MFVSFQTSGSCRKKGSLWQKERRDCEPSVPLPLPATLSHADFVRRSFWYSGSISIGTFCDCPVCLYQLTMRQEAQSPSVKKLKMYFIFLFYIKRGMLKIIW